MKLALRNKTSLDAIASNKNTALENLINSSYQCNSPIVKLEETEENIFNVSYELKDAVLINNTSTANNHSLVSNFIEVPCVNILGNFEEIYNQGLYEKIFMQTLEKDNKAYLYAEFLKYVTKNNKDYFLVFEYEKTVSYELIDGKIYNVTTINGINEKFISVDKTELTKTEHDELLTDLKELELLTDTNENLALSLLELEVETTNIYELLRVYTMYISLSVGIYLDDKAKRNERKSSKRNGMQEIETETTKLQRVK